MTIENLSITFDEAVTLDSNCQIDQQVPSPDNRTISIALKDFIAENELKANCVLKVPTTVPAVFISQSVDITYQGFQDIAERNRVFFQTNHTIGAKTVAGVNTIFTEGADIFTETASFKITAFSPFEFQENIDININAYPSEEGMVSLDTVDMRAMNTDVYINSNGELIINESGKGEFIEIYQNFQEVFAGEGNDTVDASSGRGNNSLFGKEGNDLLIAGRNDTLVGNEGIDYLLAFEAVGSNQLRAGRGDDFLVAGKQDILFGCTGNDILFAGKANNKLVGGKGKDQFAVAMFEFPTKVNKITDFEIGTDKLGIFLEEVNEFDDLELLQTNKGTLVQVGGNDIVFLQNITATDLTADDVLFSPIVGIYEF